MALVVKDLPASAGALREVSSIPGLGRSPGEENDYSLQDSCVENSVNRGASRAIVPGVAKSRTQLRGCIYIYTLRLFISSRGNVTNVDLPGISLLSESSNLLA